MLHITINSHACMVHFIKRTRIRTNETAMHVVMFAVAVNQKEDT